MKSRIIIVNTIAPQQIIQRDMLRNLKYEAKHFCLNTALHGYKYIVLPNRILLERVIWLVVVFVSIIAALTLLFVAWFNFQENPTILVTDSTHYSIWNYPFPAVTVCNFNKISRKSAYRLAKSMKKPYNITNQELAEDFKLVFQAFHNDNKDITNRNYTRLQDILESNDLSLSSVIETLSPKCNDSLQRCLWKGEEKKCESLFETVKTTEGFCCSFNYFALKNHTFKGVSSSKAPKKPRHVSATGYTTALEVLLNTNPKDYFASQLSAYGHKILIHNSYDYPDWTVQRILTETKIINLIGLNIALTYATPEIRKLEVGMRKCLFGGEIHLKSFERYTLQNCLVECRINLSKKFCGCIPFFLYIEGGYQRPRLCTLRDITCLSQYRQFIWSSVTNFNKTSLQDIDIDLKKMKCQCLPECEYLVYTAESSSGNVARRKLYNKKHLFGGVRIHNQSVFRVFHNDLVATRNRRDVSFNWHTLLGYYGGLLGLFTGCSFVTGIEILYQFTLRLFCDCSMRVKKDEENIANLPTSHRTYNLERLDPKYFLDSFKNKNEDFSRNENLRTFLPNPT